MNGRVERRGILGDLKKIASGEAAPRRMSSPILGGATRALAC